MPQINAMHWARFRLIQWLFLHLSPLPRLIQVH
jgi:hypothetical protein